MPVICQLYSNISQILLLYQVWGYNNKFDFTKSLGVYYWSVKMPRCGCVEHGLEYIMFYVEKHIAHSEACPGSPAGLRRATRGARISETHLLIMVELKLLFELCQCLFDRWPRWEWSIDIHWFPIHCYIATTDQCLYWFCGGWSLRELHVALYQGDWVMDSAAYGLVHWLDLTHWGRATHICVGKLTTIGSDNGLSPGRRQAIIWTNDGILLIWPIGTNFSEMLIGIHIFSFKKMRLKMSSGYRRPFCPGLNVLTHCGWVMIDHWQLHMLFYQWVITLRHQNVPNSDHILLPESFS